MVEGGESVSQDRLPMAVSMASFATVLTTLNTVAWSREGDSLETESVLAGDMLPCEDERGLCTPVGAVRRTRGAHAGLAEPEGAFIDGFSVDIATPEKRSEQFCSRGSRSSFERRR